MILYVQLTRIGFLKILGNCFHYESIPKVVPFLVCFLCTIPLLYAQDSPMVSGDYTNTPLKEVVLELEQKSGYSFFFLEDMVVKDTITATFDNQPISLVLDQVLEGTSLNHYILKAEKRIVLLENTVVYDELPLYFFGKDSTNVRIGTVRAERKPSSTNIF